MKTRANTKKPRSLTGFTLIELLVTMAIIAILASILVPLAGRMVGVAKRNKAMGETHSIVMAVQNYAADYGRMPIPGAGGGALSSKDIVKVLIGEDLTRNPRNTVYLSLENSSIDGTFLDPWGTQYEIHLDHDVDGRISYAGTVYKTSALAVSKGPNRSGPPGDTDDITSFR